MIQCIARPSDLAPAARLAASTILALGLSLGLGLTSTAARAETVLKVGYSVPRDSHYDVGTAAFCEEIEKTTSARYKCQIFPAAALGGEREQIEAVQLGTQDVVITSSGPLGNFIPDVRILDIPFLFRDYDHARKVLDGPIGQGLLDGMPKRGLIGLAWAENGFRHMTNSKHPIVSAKDAAGLKIRTMENKVHMDGYKAFGLLPTPMAFPELFTALQQGTVDGQENPLPVILSSKFAQVQKHLSMTGHVYSPAIYLMSPAVWSKMNADDRKAFVTAARNGATAMRQRVNDDEKRGIEQLRKDGMEVVEQVDGASFRNAITPAYQQYAKEFGADRIAAIQAVK